MTDSWSQRIVDGGMADSTLNAHGFQVARLVEESGTAHDGVQLQQCDSDRWILKIDLAGFQSADEGLWQCILIDLKPHGERSLWIDPKPHSSQLLSLDRFVDLKRTAPEVLLAERVITKCVEAAVKHFESVKIRGAVAIVVIGSRDTHRMLQTKTG